MLKSNVTLALEQPLPFQYSFTCTFIHSLGAYSPFKGDGEGGLSRPHAPFADMPPTGEGANRPSQMQKEQWRGLRTQCVGGRKCKFSRMGEIAIGKTWAQDLFISQSQREIINRLAQE